MARSPGGGNPDQSARRGKSSTQSLACALWVMAERQLDTLISSIPMELWAPIRRIHPPSPI